VAVINGATCNGSTRTGCGQSPPTVAAGYGALEAAIDPTTGELYTSNLHDNSVSGINGNTCNAQQTIGCSQTPRQDAVGNYPSSIAVDPATGTAYVANITNLSVIPLTP